MRHHREAIGQALRRLAVRPVNSLLGALVLGITLALPAGGQMLLANLFPLAREAAAGPQLSLFMTPDAGRKDAAEIESRLRRHPLVKETRFVPREDALRRLKATAGLGEVVDSLPRNPLPDAFIVAPRRETPEEMERLRAELAQYPRVEHVQLDSAWVRKLDALLRLGRLGVALLGALLGLALVAVTFNTIRLQILSQGAEIEVSRLLGATDAFVRRPFYYFGALQGFAGGAVAWCLVLGATLALRAPLAELVRLYGAEVALRPLPMADSLLLLGFATALGWAGAWLSLGRHLRRAAS